MKRYLLLILLLPLTLAAQTKADYNDVMKKFVKFYNKGQGDSIGNMFSPKYGGAIKRMWTPDKMKTMYDSYGKIKSYKYIGPGITDKEMTTFETVFSKIGKNSTGMTLTKGNYLDIFVLLMQDPDAGKKLKK